MFSETMSTAATLANGFGLTILGMGVVFAVLVVLSFALDVMRVLLADRENAPAGPSTDAPAPDTAVREDNEQLVAVITAAIAAYTDVPADGVLVKSIRPLPQSGLSRGTAGRTRQMADRLV